MSACGLVSWVDVRVDGSVWVSSQVYHYSMSVHYYEHRSCLLRNDEPQPCLHSPYRITRDETQ